jgi:hypothetical protein
MDKDRTSLTCCRSGCTVLLGSAIDTRAGDVYAEANPTTMDPKDTDKAAITCNRHIKVLLQCRILNGFVMWSEFLATDTEVLGSIPGASRYSGRQWVWNGVHSAS